MIAVLNNVVDQSTLAKVRQVLASSKFVDGKLSAGPLAVIQKQNEEVTSESEQYPVLNEMVMGALVRHSEFKAICWPAKTASPIYSRYHTGMHYGPHVDNPIMGQNALYRSDISFTFFLSDPETYQGGELILKNQSSEQSFKLDAGSVIFYPSTYLHEVKPVTDGERLVAVSWIQSRIRDAAKREILYDLYQARESLANENPSSNAYLRIDASFNNLIRRWIEI